MGKVKRLRQKLHLAAKTENPISQEPESRKSYLAGDILPLPGNDLFVGLNIDVDTLKTKLTDDLSLKSFKSAKSERTGQIVIPKKDKLKLRRDMLLRKIDSVNQMKRDLKLREKRKATAIIGDTNPLHDALPSLESLFKNRPNIKQSITEPKKKRSIEKARRRKKELIQGLKIYKTIVNNKTFQSNPLQTISQHLQVFVGQEKQKLKKN